MTRLTRAGVVAAALGLAMGASAVATAMIPDSATHLITGCYAKDGSLRVVDAQSGAVCRKGETVLTWNQAGSQGPPGPQGPRGDAGPAGPAGNSLVQTLQVVKAEVSVTCLGATDPPAVDEHDSVTVTLPAGSYLPVFSGITNATPNNAQSWELDVNTAQDASRLSTYFGGGYEQVTFSPLTLSVPTPIVVHSAARLTFDCGGPSIQGTVNFLRVG